MKIAIYTIAKNESHNVKGFMQAAEGCPVYVLDTGSSDNTVDLLKQHGAIVEQKIITPWRFDTARQEALHLVPEDVELCISIDMDERLESGWQDKLKAEWKEECNYGNYRYISAWQDKAKTIPATESARTRIHLRKGFHWERPVHEIPVPDEDTDINVCDTTLLVKHYSDNKQRNYEPLLTQILELNPNDANTRLQRGGEFVQKREWANALIDYECWLKLTKDDNRDTIRYMRANTYIATAQCYYELNLLDKAMQQLLAAVAAEPACREAWVNLAHTYSSLGNHAMAYGFAVTALQIEKPPYHAAIDSLCWGDLPKEIAKKSLAEIINNAKP
jgi:tetratricopeptide (TPR) repeat protein